MTDVTEFRVHGQKLYLSPITDIFNGEIIAYKIARAPVFGLVRDMFLKALRKLKPGEKPMLHSDQGWQYHMPDYRECLKQHGLIQNMSRKGNCLDNAAMESFFATLKSECFYTAQFDSAEQLEKQLHSYIHYYNHKRIKLKLNDLSPLQYRNLAVPN